MGRGLEPSQCRPVHKPVRLQFPLLNLETDQRSKLATHLYIEQHINRSCWNSGVCAKSRLRVRSMVSSTYVQDESSIPEFKSHASDDESVGDVCFERCNIKVVDSSSIHRVLTDAVTDFAVLGRVQNDTVLHGPTLIDFPNFLLTSWVCGIQGWATSYKSSGVNNIRFWLYTVRRTASLRLMISSWLRYLTSFIRIVETWGLSDDSADINPVINLSSCIFTRTKRDFFRSADAL